MRGGGEAERAGDAPAHRLPEPAGAVPARVRRVDAVSTPGRVSNSAHHTAAHIATALNTRSSLHYRTDRIDQHYIDACPFTMMDCLFGCGARHARQDTESHAAVCPNVLAECDAGCGWRCKRVEMPSHVIICPLREAECPNKWWDQVTGRHRHHRLHTTPSISPRPPPLPPAALDRMGLLAAHLRHHDRLLVVRHGAPSRRHRGAHEGVPVRAD